MKKQKVFLSFVFVLALTILLSSIAFGHSDVRIKHDIGLLYVPCVCCGGPIVLVERLAGETYESIVVDTGKTERHTCFFCNDIRTFKIYNKVWRYYENIHVYNECVDCGWHSKGWYEKANFLNVFGLLA